MDRCDVERQLMEFLSGIIRHDFTSETSLVKSRILSSLELVELILWIEDMFDLELNPQDITAEEFDTPKLMAGYICGCLSMG